MSSATRLLALGTLLHVVLFVGCSLGLVGAAWFLVDASSQMPGIDGVLVKVVLGLGLLSVMLTCLQPLCLWRALSLRRSPSVDVLNHTFYLHIGLAVFQSLIVLVGLALFGFGLFGCSVVPILFIPGVVLGFMGRSKALRAMA